jgi:hypothetical protein
MKLILKCKKALSLSPDEIIGLVNSDTLSSIKKSDPNPILKAYVLASEGVAYPEIVDESGNTKSGVTMWTKDAIKQVAHAVMSGVTKLFAGHTQSNDYESAKGGQFRDGDAQVVASAVMNDNSTDYNVIVAHFNDKESADKYDAVSMEVEYESTEGGSKRKPMSIIQKVIDVFGIALLGHGVEPAFSSARSLGIAHAHYVQDDRNVRIAKNESNEGIQKMDLSTIDFDELKYEFVTRRKARVWQLFTPEEVFGTPTKTKDGSIEYIGGDREIEKFISDRVDENTQSVSQEWTDKIEASTARIKELEPLEGQVKKYQSIPALQKKIAEAKLPPVVVEAINAKLDSFNPGDDIEASADEFIAAEKAHYDRYAPRGSDEGLSLGGSDQNRPDEKGTMGVDDA